MANTPKNSKRIQEFFDDLGKFALKYADINYELCATYVSPGVTVDAGGFIIIGGHLVKVPGWQPDGMESNKANIAVASAALTITSLMPAGEERQKAEKMLLKRVGIEAGKSQVVAA